MSEAGETLQFPRRGAFAVRTKDDGTTQLGIINRIGHESETVTEEVINAKNALVRRPVFDTTVLDEVEFHALHTGRDVVYGEWGKTAHGETLERIINVPVTQIRQATWAEIEDLDRVEHGPDWGHRKGYTLDPEHVAQLTPLQKRRGGFELSADEAAEADSAEQAEVAQRQLMAAIAAHPDAQAFEAEVEAETQAFIANVAARREAKAQEIAAKITTPGRASS